MSCAHAYLPLEGGEGIFSIDASNLAFGRGALAEVGAHARGLGMRRVAVFTDPTVGRLVHVATVTKALADAGIDVAFYDGAKIEPTDASFQDAARFATEGGFDGYVSVGGGSVIDTCKAAILYATHPADFLTYVNKPVGAGEPVPGPLPPHIACPTTSGTASELTGIAVCDVVSLGVKTAIASRLLKPRLAVVDPDVTRTLPSTVVASSGFDVLCHAIESFTARPYRSRARPEAPSLRPMSQGNNPWSDLGSLEALRLCGRYLARAVADADDEEARGKMMWAATLAGIAFGNAGVHLPHGMAYAVAGLARSFHMPGYPTEKPLVPHGISVVASAPEAFRFTAPASPRRHLEAAAALGEDVGTAKDADAGEIVARALVRLMDKTEVPRGLRALGFDASDVESLVRGTNMQRRLLDNAPRAIAEQDLDTIFRAALHANPPTPPNVAGRSER